MYCTASFDGTAPPSTPLRMCSQLECAIRGPQPLDTSGWLLKCEFEACTVGWCVTCGWEVTCTRYRRNFVQYQWWLVRRSLEVHDGWCDDHTSICSVGRTGTGVPGTGCVWDITCTWCGQIERYSVICYHRLGLVPNPTAQYGCCDDSR
jgi:hypothetical protein